MNQIHLTEKDNHLISKTLLKVIVLVSITRDIKKLQVSKISMHLHRKIISESWKII